MHHLLQNPKTSALPDEGGSIVITIIYIMLFMSTMLFGVLLLANANVSRAYQRIFLLEAQYSAESGADAAIAILNNTNSSYTGTTSEVTVLSNSMYKATYSTVVTNGSGGAQKIIVATGRIYKPAGAGTATYTRTIRVTADRTSSSGASGLMSRNIIDVDSSVKTIQSKSIYLNGFLNVRSNSTTVQAESITVGSKDTGASNCSIEGSGHLAKATTLSASQKATIDVAFNNCITPPGNISNTDFTVTPNDSSITAIQSMYIPWSQYMDNTYQNSPTGCNDWLGSGPITIPSTGNTKKTHYPDSGSGVSSSCGTSGDLSLGSKLINITDNVHVRANFCRTTACNPTFNNTSGSLKFVFIEGTINFTTVRTCTNVAGTPADLVALCGGAVSSPIVFITYGADPGLQSKCPYGDSIFMSNNGSSSIDAPAAYFLATNSVCIYQPKFGNNPALGGLGGKNLFISSNSGSPFDVYLDPAFPLSSIPVNLSWRAIGYERL